LLGIDTDVHVTPLDDLLILGVFPQPINNPLPDPSRPYPTPRPAVKGFVGFVHVTPSNEYAMEGFPLFTATNTFPLETMSRAFPNPLYLAIHVLPSKLVAILLVVTPIAKYTRCVTVDIS
jgi:hypothetical protein